MIFDQDALEDTAPSWEEAHEHSFWASYADIMTMVVMVFLMALLVALIQSYDLMAQLKASFAKEHAAIEAARSSLSAKDSLAQENTELRSQTTTLTELVAQLLTHMHDQNSAYLKLEASHTDATAALHAEAEALKERLSAAELAQSSSEANLAHLKTQLEAAQRGALVQEEAYHDLKVRYDKLIRPARSPDGKQVVLIRYMASTAKDERTYSIMGPHDSTPVPVTENELVAHLNALKAEYPKTLYLKIIFPEGNAVSHQEAWTFTSRFLGTYDYYYQ